MSFLRKSKLLRRATIALAACATLAALSTAALFSLDRAFPPPLPEKIVASKEVVDRDGVLLRAYALPPAIAAEDYGTYVDELFNQLEREAGDYLAEKVKELTEKGVESVSTVVKVGYGAEEIIALARETDQNLIAMCTHGRSGVRRWVLGSVTERVVRHSGDPVLIIRAT